MRVIATAGHVDHGKSAIVLRLTGIDPDRLAEEKRRGLTIDLGFAWTVLPSGEEIGFVDVPGHERFVRNMLAGVGPVRLVLFVVAADEGWKPQSEEHLAIVDVLGVEGGVIALSKRDLVDPETLARRGDEVRARVGGTGLEGAPIVPCSAATGEGFDDLRAALDAMVSAAPQPASDGRPRLFADRVFTIRGAGTVVTGTLTGGPLAVSQETEVVPSGHRARIRGLQTHKRTIPVAEPVARVAVNLTGTARAELERGDVLGLPGQWRSTSTFEASLRLVRGLEDPLGSRGAFKVHIGSAERDARIRLYGVDALRPGERAFARITVSRPVVADVFDPFVVRDAGRQATVAGGVVLDVVPPRRPGVDADARLAARAGADRSTVARLLVAERGVVAAADVLPLTGATDNDAVERGAVRAGPWLADPGLLADAGARLQEALLAHHDASPHSPGLDPSLARAALGLERWTADPRAAEAVLAELVGAGTVARTGSAVHLPGRRAPERDPEMDRLVEAVRTAEPSPPAVRELAALGFGLDLIRAACSAGQLVRVSPDLVVTPALLADAEATVRRLGRPPGLTVAAFRDALGTSRKFALPILEYFDARGVTRREGDVRFARS